MNNSCFEIPSFRRGADNPPPRGFSKLNMDGCICDISDGVHTVFRGPSKCVSKGLGVKKKDD